jgi:FkbM family methyltransferase
MELKILQYLETDKPGCFVELGANNGFLQSNTYLLQYGLGWKGILIEPVPRLFEELKKNRSSKNIYLENKVVTDPETARSTVEIMDVGLMSYVVNSLDEAHEKEQFETGKKFSKHPPKSHQIQSTTLSKLLTGLQIDQVDFLSLDVEGHELNVLKGIDFQTHAPRLALVECNDYQNTVQYLTKVGYSIAEKFDDKNLLFKLKPKNKSILIITIGISQLLFNNLNFVLATI